MHKHLNKIKWAFPYCSHLLSCHAVAHSAKQEIKDMQQTSHKYYKMHKNSSQQKMKCWNVKNELMSSLKNLSCICLSPVRLHLTSTDSTSIIIPKQRQWKFAASTTLRKFLLLVHMLSLCTHSPSYVEVIEHINCLLWKQYNHILRRTLLSKTY